jgi:DNA-directed RNA polymerase specialized sigma24 family protein
MGDTIVVLLMRGRGAREVEIETLYRERFRAFALAATALVRDGEAALDVVQDAFAIALRRRGSFRGDGNLEAWLWRIVINVAHDRRRVRRRESRPLPVLRALVTESESPDDVRAVSVRTRHERTSFGMLSRYASAEVAPSGDLRR